MTLTYGSVCSGIEAATVAWHPLGWQPQFFSEIEKFPCAVLKHHFPSVPNFGDMTKFMEWPDDRIDVLVGGTPCQSFSVAGLRQGLADPRGNLALVYLGILDKYRPAWCVWENVPGVLSSSGGRDFGSFLGALGQLGYSFAYRVLDAQHFGVPQRRRRVFVVGHLGGDWRRAAAVLFERPSVRGDTAKGREGREGASRPPGSGLEARTLALRGREGGATAELGGTVATALRASQGGGDKPYVLTDTAGGRTITEASSTPPRNGVSWWDGGQIAPTFGARSIEQAMPDKGQFCAIVSPTVTSKWAKGSGGPAGSECGNLAPSSRGLRRLTPVECERLQGFPDDWTKVTVTTKDGPRYKAIGNSMAVPVMRWIGEGIAAVSSLSP